MHPGQTSALMFADSRNADEQHSPRSVVSSSGAARDWLLERCPQGRLKNGRSRWLFFSGKPLRMMPIVQRPYPVWMLTIHPSPSDCKHIVH